MVPKLQVRERILNCQWALEGCSTQPSLVCSTLSLMVIAGAASSFKSVRRRGFLSDLWISVATLSHHSILSSTLRPWQSSRALRP
ncbi:hypothetical protein DUNSADRAFT_17197 [Dunaliella salina]|uniref:Encoded protein n=1 Tax=Dunaliella salina TaxID=3046 RepID=A0ABQ7G287_DUNSA|nr:hypothetical protein DUNSADRAFT_17197 [Dunaliella salina]|eukprot:KAF5828713.1 hypothetical protein DUNSADRAFT_17197 [Dunaliella salina]